MVYVVNKACAENKENTLKAWSVRAIEVVLLVTAHYLSLYVILLPADHFQKHTIISLINFLLFG